MNNQFKTVILLGLLSGLMLGIGALIGGQFGLTIAIIFAVLMNLLSYFFSDKLVLWIYKAKEIKEKDNPKLFKMIKDIARIAQIPVPRVYIIPTESPNAFATGRSPKHASVACTRGILDLLDEKELRGVLAHELSHVKNRDILIATIAATIAAVISYIAAMARWAAIFGIGGDDRKGGGILELLLLGILSPLIALIIQLAISRSREYQADESAAKLLHDREGLSSALLKLEANIKHNPLGFGSTSTSSIFIANPFKASAFLTMFSTHPTTENRVKRLKELKY